MLSNLSVNAKSRLPKIPWSRSAGRRACPSSRPSSVTAPSPSGWSPTRRQCCCAGRGGARPSTRPQTPRVRLRRLDHDDLARVQVDQSAEEVTRIGQRRREPCPDRVCFQGLPQPAEQQCVLGPRGALVGVDLVQQHRPEAAVGIPKARRFAGADNWRFTDSVVLSMMSAGCLRADSRVSRRWWPPMTTRQTGPRTRAYLSRASAGFGQSRSPSQEGQRRYGQRYPAAFLPFRPPLGDVVGDVGVGPNQVAMLSGGPVVASAAVERQSPPAIGVGP